MHEMEQAKNLEKQKNFSEHLIYHKIQKLAQKRLFL